MHRTLRQEAITLIAKALDGVNTVHAHFVEARAGVEWSPTYDAHLQILEAEFSVLSAKLNRDLMVLEAERLFE